MDAKKARKPRPVAGTHDDTATSTKETIVQYYAVHLHGETAISQPGEEVNEQSLIEMLSTSEYLKLNGAHTLLKKTIEVVYKRDL